MGVFKDLTGQKFGRLTVIKRAENKGKKVAWVCKCDCGNTKIVMSCSLTRGRSISCDCFHKEKMKGNKSGYKHRQRNTRLYKEWLSMKQRCYNSNVKYYERYGGRGITVCAEWLHDFQAFYAWALDNGYSDVLEIDRIDVNGNYEPSNCRWVTQTEQANNTSRNHYLTYNGETHTISEWAKIKQMTYSKLLHRISRGWSIEKALTTK